MFALLKSPSVNHQATMYNKLESFKSIFDEDMGAESKK